MPGGDAPQSVSAAPFDFTTRLGIVFISEACIVSAVAVLGLLGYIVYSAVTIKKNALRNWSTVTHVHYYFLSMLVSELVQAAGGLLNIRWIVEASVTTGSYCTAQGALKNMGDVGVAFASLAIAIHTFLILAFRWRPDPSPRIAIAVIAGIWLFLVLIQVVIFSSHKKNYYGNTQYWCWITSDYPGERLGLEYAWMWITSLLNFVLYTVLVFVIKGYVVFNGWKVRFPRQEDRIKVQTSSTSDSSYAKDASDIAWRMLFYPVIYTITVLPIAIVRWSSFFHSVKVPFWATVLADLIFACSGVLNVLLFTITRPMLVPKRTRRTTLSYTPFSSHNTSSRPGAIESFEDEWAVAPRHSGSREHTPLEHKRSILHLHIPRSPESAV